MSIFGTSQKFSLPAKQSLHILVLILWTLLIIKNLNSNLNLILLYGQLCAKHI